jgi:hypothetical protein
MKAVKAVAKGAPGKGPATIAVTRSSRTYPKGGAAPEEEGGAGALGSALGMKKGGKVAKKGK